MSVVQVLNPPDFETADFELCYAESLGLIVYCKTDQVMVLLWDDDRMRWKDHEGNVIEQHHRVYTIRCWAGCGKLVHRPGTHIVKRFQELNRG